MKIDLAGRTAVVSGSSGGIGLAIAEGLAGCGARVVIAGRNHGALDKAAAGLEAVSGAGPIKAVVADLATAEGVEKLTTAAPEADILCNNLGIYDFKPFSEYGDAEWERFFQVNVMSGVRLTRHYLPQMTANGWGRVVFVSSESALNVPPDMIPYAMTKTAQLTIARGLAETVAGTGVTVNSVLPGPTLTQTLRDMFERQAAESGTAMEEAAAAFVRKERPTSLIQRMLDPSEVANMVVYLCSEQASGTSGAPVRVEGGLLRSIA